MNTCSLSDHHSNAIAERVIKSLQSLRKNCLLSGDDSGLETTWDEICVQVQTELSTYWDVYAETIRNCIREELENEPQAIKNLLSYLGNKEFEEVEGFNLEFVIKPIYSKVMALADSNSSRRVKKYLEVNI